MSDTYHGLSYTYYLESDSKLIVSDTYHDLSGTYLIVGYTNLVVKKWDLSYSMLY